MTIEDAYNTLVQLKMLTVDDSSRRLKPMPGQTIKVQKGRKSGVARKHLQRTQTNDDEKVKGPFVLPTSYEIHWDPDEVEQYMARWEAKGYLTLKPEKLKWSPFIVARMRKSEQLSSDQPQQAAKVDLVAAEAGARLDISTETRSTSIIATKSPAFSLFDDDNVITISTSREASRVQPDAETVRSPSAIPDSEARSTQQASSGNPQTPRRTRPESIHEKEREVARDSQADDLDQLELDRAFAEQLARDESRSRLRNRVHSEPSAPIPRDEPTTRKGRPPAGRRASTRTGGDNSGAPVGDDAALAAQLARENAPRLLRARSNTEQQDAKRADPTPRSASPRKRRRVDSPDMDRTLSASMSPPITRRNNRRSLADSPLPKDTTAQRKASRRLTNGTAGMTPRQRQAATRPTSGTSGTAVLMYDREEEEESSGGETHKHAMAADKGQREPIIDVSVNEPKYEDTGTPLTATTARHSAPSDDTVFVAEEHAGGTRKTSPARHIIVKVPTATPVNEQESDRRDGEDFMEVDKRIGGDVEAEREGEADAEGEPDLDGEPDLEML